MSEPVSERLLLARATWSRLVEPGDVVAGALVGALGPIDALEWLQESGPVSVLGPDGRARAALAAAAERWRTRLPSAAPERDVSMLDRIGGRLLVPESEHWPVGLADLGPAAPMCLWVRGAGDAELNRVLLRSVAVVGSRACTDYGRYVTAELAAGLAERGWGVVSGGAYGVDAVAHRAALAVAGTTVAFLAGGVDRLYPAGNTDLLREVARGGALISEVGPGSVPAKVRFLQRNRLIAAVSRATVVVEAAWRSGALATARHAAGLLRPVGAVPGPVTSAGSAGCHRLLREGVAVCVTDAAEVIELIAPEPAPEHRVPSRDGDGLDLQLRRTLDALPLRRPVPDTSIARTAGLSEREARAALGRLELSGLAVRVGSGWRRASRSGA